jgi:hypothetical protein
MIQLPYTVNTNYLNTSFAGGGAASNAMANHHHTADAGGRPRSRSATHNSAYSQVCVYVCACLCAYLWLLCEIYSMLAAGPLHTTALCIGVSLCW